MKSLSFLLAGAFCLAIGTASAQHDDKAEAQASAKAKAAMLTQDLSLSADQAKQVEDLLVSAEGKMTHQHAEGASAAKAEKRYDQVYDRIATLLTAEQATKFTAMRSSGKLNASGKGCCAGHGAGGCCSGKGSASKEGAKDMH